MFLHSVAIFSTDTMVGHTSGIVGYAVLLNLALGCGLHTSGCGSLGDFNVGILNLRIM